MVFPKTKQSIFIEKGYKFTFFQDIHLLLSFVSLAVNVNNTIVWNQLITYGRLDVNVDVLYEIIF